MLKKIVLSAALTVALLTLHTSTEAQLFKFRKKPAPRPKVYLKVSNETVKMGDSITISWNATHANMSFKVLLNNQPVAPTGSSIKIIDTTQTIVLAATDENGKTYIRKREVKTLTPAITQFSTSETTDYGKAAHVSWATKNMHKVFVNNTKQDLSGVLETIIKNDTTITLTAITKNGKTFTQTDTIRVRYPYEIRTYINNKRTYNSSTSCIIGDSVTISWDLTFADSISIDEKPVQNKIGKISFQVWNKKDIAFSYKTRRGIMAKHNIHIETIETELVSWNITNVSPANPFASDFPINYSEDILENKPYRLSWMIKNAREVWIDDTLTTGKGTKTFLADTTRSHKISYTYYDSHGRMNKVTHVLKLITSDRPYFSGKVRYTIENETDPIFVEIIGIDQKALPDTVKLKVVAIDKDANFISGLADDSHKSIFEQVIETYNKKSTKISNLKIKEVKQTEEAPPQDIMLVIDYSGSMSSEYKKLDKVIEKCIKMKRPQDRLSFVKFDHRLVLPHELTENSDSISEYFKQYKFHNLGGATALYAATDLGILNLTDSIRPKKIILFTDGYENSSMFYSDSLNYNWLQVLMRSREAEVPLFIVSLGQAVAGVTLKTLADISYGHYYPLNSMVGTSKAFDEIFNTMTNYYEISYTPYRIQEGLKNIQLVYKYDGKNLRTSDKDLHTGNNFSMFEDIESVELDSVMQQIADSLMLTPISTAQNMANFNFNSTQILPRDTASINQYADILLRNENYKAIVTGHTDKRGNHASCDKLSFSRAKVIRNQLVAKGIDASRIYCVGMGKRHPIWKQNTTKIQDFENRRAEIILLN